MNKEARFPVIKYILFPKKKLEFSSKTAESICNPKWSSEKGYFDDYGFYV